MLLSSVALKKKPKTIYADSYSDWKQPVDYAGSLGLTMQCVYPRPDNEALSTERHRVISPDFDYIIPIGVSGGCWPYKYEIISGPKGCKIGSFYDPKKRGNQNKYGILRWTPNVTSGTINFIVRVTDQLGNVVNVSWSAVVGTSPFVYVDPNVVSSGSGAINSPLKSWRDWYLDDHNNNSFANKIIVLREGTHELYGAAGATAGTFNVQLSAGVKPLSIITYPGEDVVIDCSKGKIMLNGTSGAFFQGGDYTDACQLVNNAHVFWLTTGSSRVIWHAIKISNFQKGLVGDDNTNGMFIATSTTLKDHLMIKDCEFEDFFIDSNNGGFIDFYKTNNILVEGNVARNSRVSLGIHAKQPFSRTCIRNNDVYENIIGVCMSQGYWAHAGAEPIDHEMCWNRLGNTGTVTTGRLTESTGGQNTAMNVNFYKNSSYGGAFTVRYKPAQLYKIDSCFIASVDNLSLWSLTAATVTKPSTTAIGPSSIKPGLIPDNPATMYVNGCDVY